MKKNKKKLFIRSKIWIENEDGELLCGQGKTELLEFILESGSILQASKLMGISYKKAWTHLQALQKAADEQLVIAKQGRSQVSGTKLTPKALELIQNYKILQHDLQIYANKRFAELFEDKE
ncbi:hypothetical protein DMB92_07885 [Campylobacter sp. MIT 99-7217]|nr:hypothetical protein DMB92_07885 [Campylobacter sp. MIT 99-7217]